MIQSGQVSIGLIESIMVNVNGRNTPISHLGFSQVTQNGIAVNIYDVSLVGLVGNTIKGAGFSCYTYSKTQVMVSRPLPTQEEKAKSVKHLKGLAEEARVSIRKVRQDYRNGFDKTTLKELDKQIQKEVDAAIREVDVLLQDKLDSL